MGWLRGDHPVRVIPIVLPLASVLLVQGCSMERVPRSAEPSDNLRTEPIQWPKTWKPEEGYEEVVVDIPEPVFLPATTEGVHTTDEQQFVDRYQIPVERLFAPSSQSYRLVPGRNGLIGHPAWGPFFGCNSALVSNDFMSRVVDFHAWKESAPPQLPPRVALHELLPETEFSRIDENEVFGARFSAQTHPEAATVGTAIVLGPLAGAEYVEGVVQELAARGWTCITANSIIWWSLPLGMKTTDAMLVFDPDCQPMSVDPANVGASCEGTLESIGLMAMAYEEAVSYFWSFDRTLASKPLIVVGFSMGAIQAPTVAARMPRVDGAVLIGGGANLLGIIAADGVPGIAWSLIRDERGVQRTLSPQLADELSDEYLRHATLDPYNTAPLLKDKPVLMLHGRFDRRVPARFGDLLWERLGKPERWVGNYGHDLLFYFLDDHAAQIADWVDHHVIQARGNAAAQNASQRPTTTAHK